MTPPTSRSSTPVNLQAPKKKRLSAETEETENLSTTELQRLVLLEQLKYTRAKMRRLEQQNSQTTEAADPPVDMVHLTDMDNWRYMSHQMQRKVGLVRCDFQDNISFQAKFLFRKMLSQTGTANFHVVAALDTDCVK